MRRSVATLPFFITVSPRWRPRRGSACPSPLGWSADDAAGLIERVRRALRQDEVLFSFHLDEPHSVLWAVTRDEFQMLRLPAGQPDRSPDQEIPRPGREGAARRPFPVGSASSVSCSARCPAMSWPNHDGYWRWMAILFQLPFAALVAGHSGGRPEYLAENHSTMITPSALLLNRGRVPGWQGAFVGLGDPIYNAADPRRATAGRARVPGGLFLQLLAARVRRDRRRRGIELPRLVGQRPGDRSLLCGCCRPVIGPILLTGRGSDSAKVG